MGPQISVKFILGPQILMSGGAGGPAPPGAAPVVIRQNKIQKLYEYVQDPVRI